MSDHDAPTGNVDQPHLRPRTPLQQSMADLFAAFGVSEEFMEATDHERGCRCAKCLAWWREMAVCEDGEWETGPFTLAELFPDGPPTAGKYYA